MVLTAVANEDEEINCYICGDPNDLEEFDGEFICPDCLEWSEINNFDSMNLEEED